MNSIYLKWRVQVKDWGRWKNRGLFETRKDAREEAAHLRTFAYGFGNTRVIRHEVRR